MLSEIWKKKQDRVVVYFDEEQAKRLKTECQKAGVAVAAKARELLMEWLEGRGG